MDVVLGVVALLLELAGLEGVDPVGGAAVDQPPAVRVQLRLLVAIGRVAV